MTYLNFVVLLVMCMSTLSHSVTLTESEAMEFRQSFRNFLDEKLQEYKRDLSKVMLSNERSRQKRNIDVFDVSTNNKWRIEQSNIDAWTEGVTRGFTTDSNTYILNAYEDIAEISMFLNDNGRLITNKLSEYDASFVKDLLILPLNNTVVFLVTAIGQFNSGNTLSYTGRSTVHIWDGTASVPEPFFTFTTNGASAIDCITYHGILIFGVANFRSDLNVKYRNDIRIYEWKESYFDEILVYETHGATDIEFFKVGEELYVAVTQFVNDEFEYDIGSLILKIDLYSPSITLIQTVPTTAPRSVTAFKMNHNTFIAFTNNVIENDQIQYEETYSTIYWWSGQLVLEYQSLPTTAAKEIIYVHLANGDDILIVANEDPYVGAVIYECDDAGDWVLSTQQFPQWNARSGGGAIIHDMSVFELDGNVYTLFTYGENSTDLSDFSSFYWFNFMNESKEITQETHEILSSIPELKDSMRENIERLGELSTELETKASISKNESIYSNLRFTENVTFENTLYVENFTADYFALESLVLLRYLLNKHERNLDLIETEMLDFVSLYVEDQLVRGTVTFYSLLNVTSLNVNDSVVSTNDLINGVNIEHIDSVSIKKNENAVIFGNITFTETVTAGASVFVLGLANGHKIPDDYLLITNGSQVYIGDIQFDTDVHVDELALNGTLNGIYIPEELVIMTKDHQYIEGNKTFWGNVTVLDGADMLLGTTMNGIDLYKFINSVFLTSDDIILEDDVVFEADVYFDNLLILDGHIDSTNINKFKNVVKTHGDVVIEASQNLLGSLTTFENLHLLNELNGIDISEDLIRTIGSQTIYSDLLATNNITFKSNVTLFYTINGVRPENFVLLDADQEIEGPVFFTNGFSVNGDIILPYESKINNKDLSELYNRTIMIDENADIVGLKIFIDDVHFQRSLIVDGLINEINITTLDQEALRVSDNITFTSDVILDGVISMDGGISLAGTFDGQRLEDFVTLNSPQDVTGFLIFNDSLHINGSLFLEEGMTVDYVDVSEFYDKALMVNCNQTLLGNLEIIGNVTVYKNIHVSETVNECDISEDFVTLNSDQIIYGDIIVTDNATFRGNLSTNNVTVDGFVNGVNITKLDEEAVRIDSNITVEGTKEFTQNVSVDACVLVEGTINCVDVDNLYLNAIQLSADESFDADLRFESDAYFYGNISVLSKVNRIKLYEFSQRLVYTNTDEEIRGRKIFSSDVTIDGDLYVDGTIDNIYIHELYTNHLSKYSDQYINSSKVFLMNVSADAISLEDSILIDGVDISNVILIDHDYNIQVPMTFSNIMIDGDLMIKGLIGGFNITEYDEWAVRVSGSLIVIDGIKQFYGLNVDGDLVSNGTVNGTDLSDLFNNALSNENLTIEGSVTFEGFLHIEDDAWFNDHVNGENISFIIDDAVLYSESTTITGNKSVTGDVEIDNLWIDGDFEGNIVYENLTLKMILDLLVLQSENASIDGRVIFGHDVIVYGDFFVTGLINGLSMPNDFVIQNVTQTLTGSLNTFASVKFLDHTTVTNDVDTVPFDSTVANRVTLSTPQTITGTWSIGNVNAFDDVIVHGLVNTFNLSTDVVLTYGDQDIGGYKNFSVDVNILGDMYTDYYGYIDYLGPVYYAAHAVRDDVPTQISGHKHFTSSGLTFTGNITVTGYVLGVDLSDMLSNFDSNMERIESDLIQVNSSLRTQCLPIHLLEEAYDETQAVRFGYFEDYQTINRTDVATIYAVAYEDTLLISVTENQYSEECIQSALYMYDDDQDTCFLVTEGLIPASTAQLFSFTFETPDETSTFLVLTGSIQSGYCTEGVDYNNVTRVILIEEDLILAEISSETPIDSDMITINGSLYLAIANSEDTVTGSSVVNSGLYLYSRMDKSFVLEQSFVTQGAITVLFIEHDDYDPWLVFANYYDSELETGLTTTDIYQWSGMNFELQHQISGEYIDVVNIEINGQPCVVSSSERNNDDTTDYYMPVVTVCFKDEQWAEITEFEGQGVIGLDSFSVDGTPYLVVLSQFGEIHVYKWCGISGFEMYLNIPYSDVNSVNVFMYDGSLLMGVARFFVSEIADQVGDTRILKGIINGLKEETIIEA